MQIGYGDMARSLMMSRQNAATKAEMTRLSQEVTTGLAADSARHLSGDLGHVNALDAAQARLAAYATTTSELATRATAMQSALGTVSELAATAVSSLLPLDAMATPARVDAAATGSRAALDTVMTTLNTRFGDRGLFSGTATASAPLASSAQLLTALQSVIAGATGAADAEAAVTDWFSDPAGYHAMIYAGGDVPGAIPVAEGETVSLDVTADDPALRDLIRGLSLATLVGEGLFAGQPEARRTLAERAGTIVLGAQDGLTATRARLGLAEARIADAATRNDAEGAAYDLARADLLGIDGYDAATRLTGAEERLQLLYALTARLSNLSLVDYI